MIESVELTADESAYAKEIGRSLDDGEAVCIAAASSRSLLVLTDDREARQFARALDLTVSGTVGVLNRLIKSGDLSLQEADALLDTMVKHGYRSPVRSLREVAP